MAGNGENQTLKQLGEEGLVSRLLEKLPVTDSLIVGPGDDCAVVRGGDDWWQLFKTDCIVEGVHFSRGTDPVLIGKKAMNRTISDMAAMGGLPEYAVVTIASDGERPVSEVEGWYDGLLEAAGRFDCLLVGGETTSLPQPGGVLSIAMTGRVEPARCVLRSGANVGDKILVTGKLGGSFASGRHLNFIPRIAEARWLVEHVLPTSMMDLSDGLGSDLPRLVAASGVGYQVDADLLPLHEGVSREEAVSDGEDYELLLTTGEELTDALLDRWTRVFPETPLTCIGEVTERTEISLGKGWEHYREA